MSVTVHVTLFLLRSHLPGGQLNSYSLASIITDHMIKNLKDHLGFGLSRELWLVVLGMFLNYLGYGAVLPFEVIYLHDGRGFSLGVAGLVVGLCTGVEGGMPPRAGSLRRPSGTPR